MARQIELLLAAQSEAGRWRRDAVFNAATNRNWCDARIVDRSDQLAAGPNSALVVFDAGIRTAEIMLAAVSRGLPVATVGSGHHARPESLRRMIEASGTLHFPFSRRAARNLSKTGVTRRSMTVSLDPLLDHLAECRPAMGEACDIVVALDETRLLNREARIIWSALDSLHRKGAIERVLWFGTGPSRCEPSAGIKCVAIESGESLPSLVSSIDSGQIVISDIDWVMDLAPTMQWSLLQVRPDADRPELAARCQARICPIDLERLPVDILAMLMRPGVDRKHRILPRRSEASDGILDGLEALVLSRRFATARPAVSGPARNLAPSPMGGVS